MIGHDSVSTGVKIEERIGERFDYSLPETAESHVEGCLKRNREDASQELWEVCDKQEIQ